MHRRQLCVDPTPGVIAEAASAGCNLVVSHHPLIFRGLKHITGSTPVERAVEYSIRNGVAVPQVGYARGDVGCLKNDGSIKSLFGRQNSIPTTNFAAGL